MSLSHSFPDSIGDNTEHSLNIAARLFAFISLCSLSCRSSSWFRRRRFTWKQWYKRGDRFLLFHGERRVVLVSKMVYCRWGRGRPQKMHLGDFFEEAANESLPIQTRRLLNGRKKETGRVESGCEGRGESKMLYWGVITKRFCTEWGQNQSVGGVNCFRLCSLWYVPNDIIHDLVEVEV